jgi:hypothetical protein
MNRLPRARTAFVVLAFAVLTLVGQRVSATDVRRPPIVGAWFVKVPGAPFEYQMYIFNADGTMQESNPDAGDANASDSSGFGAWNGNGGRVVGKFVEVTADRTTRKFVSRGEISFEITVDGDAFTGTATGRFYDAEGVLVRGPVHASMKGERIRP